MLGQINDKIKPRIAALKKQRADLSQIAEEIRDGRVLSATDLVSVDDLSLEDIGLIFELAKLFQLELPEHKKIPLLRGKSIINFFMEESTRTRVSFEMVGKHLSADTINVSASSSSMAKKGETLNDTARTLRSLRADLIILRHSQAGSPGMIAAEIEPPVINAGDGWHDHPTQGLLDVFTIEDYYGSIEGKTVLVVGDILHSRVAGALIRSVLKCGGKIRLSGPPTMIPKKVEAEFGVEVEYNLEKAIKDVEVVYALRVQLERAAGAFIPTIRDYSKLYCVNPVRLARAAPKAMVMHAGPINREVDLRTEVMEGPQSFVETQVANGWAIRAALLYLLTRRSS